jgi:hypothetical protein
MLSGPLLFIAIAAGIIVAALLLARLFRRTTRSPLPGSDERAAGTHWYAGRDGDGDIGGGD